MAARYYELHFIKTWSGGTEATSFNPRAVCALQKSGFNIKKISSIDFQDNPIYQVQLSNRSDSTAVYSKRYDDPSNPQTNFAAITVCSDADQSCPFVLGAELQIALPFIDPKYSDDSFEEEEVYYAKSLECGAEMELLMRRVHSLSKK